MSIGFLAELVASRQARDEDAFSVVERTPEPSPFPSQSVAIDDPSSRH